jgi:hypothetical protein
MVGASVLTWSCEDCFVSSVQSRLSLVRAGSSADGQL